MRNSFLLISLCFIYSSEAQSNLATGDSIHASRRINFIPSSFSSKFSLNEQPVLRIHSGDTISTETIDAGGFDKNGVKRHKPGNPLTGPFYVEGAVVGDVLAITFTKVALNRLNAFTTESFVSRSLPKTIINQMSKMKLVKWNLDLTNGYATIADSSYENLKNFKVPLKPFVGCIGVAPLKKNNEILSFFQGPFGGNLDFSAVTQSATIYLPVFHDGAYLYLGDGHALQGDGEIAGNALETSLDIEFTIRLVTKEGLTLSGPRVEDTTHLIAVGVDKTLDGALKMATAGLLQWLQTDYHLSLQEATQVMSTSIEYTIPEVADPEVEVAAKIRKQTLKALKRYN